MGYPGALLLSGSVASTPASASFSPLAAPSAVFSSLLLGQPCGPITSLPLAGSHVPGQDLSSDTVDTILALAKGSKVGPPPLVSWDAPLHFLHHRWLRRFSRYTHSRTQVLSSPSCSSETLLHQPTRQSQALIFHSLPVFLPQPVFSACGPGPLPRSPLITAVLPSPQPPHRFPSHPAHSRPCAPSSHPLSPGCWGCRRNAPHLPAESEPQGRLPLKAIPQASPQKLPHSFKTLSDSCCPPPPAPQVPQRKQGGP